MCVYVCVCMHAYLHVCVFYDLILEPEYYEKWFVERQRRKPHKRESAVKCRKDGIRVEMHCYNFIIM